MGQANVQRHHPKGDTIKWAQRDFEERPVVFFVKGPERRISAVVTRLDRRLRGIEKKFAATNPKAVLTLHNLEVQFSKLTDRKHAIVKRMTVELGRA